MFRLPGFVHLHQRSHQPEVVAVDISLRAALVLNIYPLEITHFPRVDLMPVLAHRRGCRPSLVVRSHCADFPSNDRLANPAFGIRSVAPRMAPFQPSLTRRHMEIPV
jgi:hypothetical protein